MASYILTYWESVKLFSELIAKTEEISPENFSAKSLKDYTDKYKSSKNEGDYMYEISKSIRSRLPLTISKKKLQESLKTLGKSEQIHQYREILTVPIIDKEFDFANTFWWIYYHAVTKKQSGVSRGILYLLPFGNAIIKRIPLDDDEKRGIEAYVGRYNQYDKDNSCLELSFHTEKKVRDLQMLIHTGESIPGVAIGSYTNNNAEEMLAGSVLIEAIKDKTDLELVRESVAKGDELIEKLLTFHSFGDDPPFNSVIIKFFKKNNVNIMKKNKHTFGRIEDSLNDIGAD